MAAEGVRLERDGVIVTVSSGSVEEMKKLGFRESGAQPKPRTAASKTASK